MKRGESGSTASSEFRKRAEKALRESPARAKPVSTAQEDLSRLVNELRIHQVELELQNEELKKSQNETATLLEDYRGLYDFAPVGYFTLDAGGLSGRPTSPGPPSSGSLGAGWWAGGSPPFSRPRAGRPSPTFSTA